MAKRLILGLLCVLAISLVVTSVALAATPQEIYEDYADDGVLNGPNAPYSDEDMKAYQNDATLHQYGEPVNGRDEFPFTGFQLMMAGVVAVVLVGGGIALRRLSRSQKS
ncbi:MAG: hypothetical protein ABH877_02540 [bacterium]